jgi:hypothetical protein
MHAYWLLAAGCWLLATGYWLLRKTNWRAFPPILLKIDGKPFFLSFIEQRIK